MASKSPGRLQYLFTSTKGLILMAAAFISIIAAIWATLSGPMVEWGVRDITVDLLNMDLIQAEREGRLVMLYHSIAMIITAIVVYLITAVVPMDKTYAKWSNGLVTFGYYLTVFPGMAFAYFGHEWTLHGVYLVGLSIIFLVGCILVVAIWPWNKKYYLKPDSKMFVMKSGFSWERFTFWFVVICAIVSAAFGAWSGSHFGNGFTAFLAEDTVRENDKTYYMKAIVGHLHIMLALIGIFATLIVGRWLDWKGILHKLGMPGFIIGSLFLTFGSLSVTVTEAAHTFVYVGAVFSMTGGLFLVIYGMPKITKDRLKEQGFEGKAGFWNTTKALLHDPLKFGVLWQMIFMNFTTSFVGIFMAAKLDDIFRSELWNHREERIELTGHWHILATIIAIMILFYYADKVNLQGKARQIFGWTILIGSDLAFTAITIFEMKRLFIEEYAQQALVNNLMLLADIGLAAVMIALAVFMVWRLVDLLKKDGTWKSDVLVEEFIVTGSSIDDPRNTGTLAAYRDQIS
ncbi:MAG: hypothetical protein AB7V16_13395 [Vulcanibacillus sp.]